MLFRVNLPYACYGIVVRHKKVVEAAPIAKWMIGVDIHIIKRWISKKGGTLECLNTY